MNAMSLGKKLSKGKVNYRKHERKMFSRRLRREASKLTRVEKEV